MPWYWLEGFGNSPGVWLWYGPGRPTGPRPVNPPPVDPHGPLVGPNDPNPLFHGTTPPLRPPFSLPDEIGPSFPTVQTPMGPVSPWQTVNPWWQPKPKPPALPPPGPSLQEFQDWANQLADIGHHPRPFPNRPTPPATPQQMASPSGPASKPQIPPELVPHLTTPNNPEIKPLPTSRPNQQLTTSPKPSTYAPGPSDAVIAWWLIQLMYSLDDIQNPPHNRPPRPVPIPDLTDPNNWIDPLWWIRPLWPNAPTIFSRPRWTMIPNPHPRRPHWPPPFPVVPVPPPRDLPHDFGPPEAPRADLIVPPVLPPRFGIRPPPSVVPQSYLYGPETPPVIWNAGPSVEGPDPVIETSSLLLLPSGAAPVVLGVTPNSGPQAGGTGVAIVGSGFTGATSVNVGAPVASFTVDSDSRISAVTAAGVNGVVPVSVHTPLGTGHANLWTYT
jgi:hypothetical protein